MKKAEIILIVLTAIAFSLSLVPIDGGSLFTVISIMTLAPFYMVFGFALFQNIRLRDIFKKESYKHTNTISNISSIATGYGISLVLLGILFTVQSWKGNFVMLRTGLLTLSVALVLVVLSFLIKKNKQYFKQTVFRIVLWGGIGIYMYNLPQDYYYDFKFRNYPTYLEASKNFYKDPQNEEYRLKFEEERMKMRMGKTEEQ